MNLLDRWHDLMQKRFPIPDVNDQETRTAIVIKLRRTVIRQNWCLFFMALGLALALVSIEIDRSHAHQLSQNSRYEVSYFSCLSADNGNKNANKDIVTYLRDPTPVNRHALIDDVRTLRSTTAPPPPPLPTPVPVAWRIACSTWAASQISLTAPPYAPPPPLSSTIQTRSQ